MDKYTFKATNLIAESFKKHRIKFEVKEAPGAEIIIAGFPIDGGPTVTEWFISTDDDNDVAVRVFQLITNIPKEKRFRVMEACNILSREVRHFKFYVDRDGNVNVEYDFLQHTPDEGVGEMALEAFFRTMKVLNLKYGYFMKALYADDELEPESLMEKLERLRRMQEAMISATDTSDDEPYDVELDLKDLELVGSPDDVAC